MGLAHHEVPVAHGPGSPWSPCKSWAWLTIESLWLMGLAHHRVPVVYGPGSPSSPYGSEVENASVESKGLRLNFSWWLRIFSLSHTHDKTENISLYFFTKLKTYHLSFPIYCTCLYIFLIHLWSRGRSNCCIKSRLSPLSAQFVSCSCSSWS